jgi:primase-polymerase (primpol)-like protein
MLSSEDPLVLVDWDNVRDRNVGNETVPEFVRDKIKEIGGYVSVSISGTGLHQLCSADEQTQELIEDNKSRADLPLDPVGRLKERPHVEIYQSKRYFTLTGDRFIDPIRGETFENLSSSNDALRSFVDQYLQSGYSTTKTNRSVGEAESSKNQSLVDLSNRAATKHAHRYSNMTWRDTDSPTVEEIKWTGFYYEGEFRKLWEGNENESDYPSRSEADEAFFSRLWFYCDDRGLLWDCLPACKRYRPKWERTDYLRRSIEKVRDNDRYNGEYRSPREKVQG